VRTQPVNGKHPERKQNAPAQIRHIEHIANRREKLFHEFLSRAPAAY
jgi:hypothetical protein